MPPTTLVRRLAAIVGPAHVLDDPELCASYGRDCTGRFGGPAALVVRPGSTHEVAQVLAACHEAGMPVVPQGGNTGLVGAGRAARGRGRASLARLDALGPVDPVAAQVTAGAGVTLERLQQHAAAAGLAFGVDHGARSGATVGGMVATNAGGAQVLRHGTMRAQVMGVEAVLADGRVLRRLAGLLKDNAGYDLDAAGGRQRGHARRGDRRAAAARPRAGARRHRAARRRVDRRRGRRRGCCATACHRSTRWRSSTRTGWSSSARTGGSPPRSPTAIPSTSSPSARQRPIPSRSWPTRSRTRRCSTSPSRTTPRGAGRCGPIARRTTRRSRGSGSRTSST